MFGRQFVVHPSWSFRPRLRDPTVAAGSTGTADGAAAFNAAAGAAAVNAATGASSVHAAAGATSLNAAASSNLTQECRHDIMATFKRLSSLIPYDVVDPCKFTYHRYLPLKLETCDIEFIVATNIANYNERRYRESEQKVASLRTDLRRHDTAVTNMSLSYSLVSRSLHRCFLNDYKLRKAEELITAMEGENNLFIERYKDVCHLLAILRRRCQLECDFVQSIVEQLRDTSQQAEAPMIVKLRSIFTKYLVDTTRVISGPRPSSTVSVGCQTCDPFFMDDASLMDLSDLDEEADYSTDQSQQEEKLSYDYVPSAADEHSVFVSLSSCRLQLLKRVDAMTLDEASLFYQQLNENKTTEFCVDPLFYDASTLDWKYYVIRRLTKLQAHLIFRNQLNQRAVQHFTKPDIMVRMSVNLPPGHSSSASSAHSQQHGYRVHLLKTLGSSNESAPSTSSSTTTILNLESLRLFDTSKAIRTLSMSLMDPRTVDFSAYASASLPIALEDILCTVINLR